MSIEAMNWALSQRTGSPAAKSVLLILANRADNKGRCWPGFDGISRQTELSRRAVIVNIKRLEESGLLCVQHRPSPLTNLYQLNLKSSAGDALVQQVHGAAAALPVVQEVHLGSAAGAPEPSLTITKPKVNRATKRVPVSWSLSDAGADFAISVGMDEQTAKDELGMFRDHEFKNARKDWDAAWRTWCRNWKKWDAGKTKKLSYSQQLARDINANQ